MGCDCDHVMFLQSNHCNDVHMWNDCQGFLVVKQKDNLKAVWVNHLFTDFTTASFFYCYACYTPQCILQQPAYCYNSCD